MSFYLSFLHVTRNANTTIDTIWSSIDDIFKICLFLQTHHLNTNMLYLVAYHKYSWVNSLKNLNSFLTFLFSFSTDFRDSESKNCGIQMIISSCWNELGKKKHIECIFLAHLIYEKLSSTLYFSNIF